MKVFVSSNNGMGHYYLFYFIVKNKQDKQDALTKLRQLFLQDETHHWLFRGYGDKEKKILSPEDKLKWDEFRNSENPNYFKFVKQMTGIRIHPFKPDLHDGTLLIGLPDSISVHEWNKCR